MKALTAVLLATLVAAAAAARLTPKLAASTVRRTAARSLTELPAGWVPMDMPAIHITEFGKELNIGDLDKHRAEGGFKASDFHVTPLDTNWAETALEEARKRAERLGGHGSFLQWSSSSTTDNSNSNNQPDKDDKNDKNDGNDKSSKKSRNPQDDCSKSDTSAYAVELCVNAVRTNPQAFQYPCDSWWLSTLARSARLPLMGNDKLDSSARRQANDMAQNSRISHVGSDGSTVGGRIKDAGYTTFPQAENIAKGQTSAHQVTMEWMCSEGHRKAIMNCEYDEVGTAVAYKDGTWYYAQNFGCSSGRCPVCEVA